MNARDRFLLAAVAALIWGMPATSRADGPDAWIEQLLAVSDVVLEQHVDPPTRQQMLLDATRALCGQWDVPLPPGLSRRLSDAASRDELRKLIVETWFEDLELSGKVETSDTALRGLLASVPGSPRFESAESFRVAQQLRGNRYVGIGIVLARDSQAKLPQIAGFHGRGPAYHAGAKPGDLILKVDDQDMAGGDLARAVAALRGDDGTDVTLVVRQPGEEAERTLKMTRGVVPTETVVGHVLNEDDSWKYCVAENPSVAYLQIEKLAASTLHELRQAAPRIKALGCRGLVLDLRNTGEHNLHHAVVAANGLLSEGLIARVQTATGVREHRARGDCLFRDVPLVVLVNGYTRGDAEWFASALQQNGRAKLLGEPTAGDVLAESSLELPFGGGLTLATGYVLPTNDQAWKNKPDDGPSRAQQIALLEVHGTSPHVAGAGRWGLRPDVIVRMDGDQHRELMMFRRQQKMGAGVASQPPADVQLERAIALLQETLNPPVGGD